MNISHIVPYIKSRISVVATGMTLLVSSSEGMVRATLPEQLGDVTNVGLAGGLAYDASDQQAGQTKTLGATTDALNKKLAGRVGAQAADSKGGTNVFAH